eukprot:Gb_35439 [translate_table: standard]
MPFEDHTSRNMAHSYLVAVYGHHGASCKFGYVLGISFLTLSRGSSINQDVTDSKKGMTLFLENFPTTWEIKEKEKRLGGLGVVVHSWQFQNCINDLSWKAVQVNEELINHITGLPLTGVKIDLNEEARHNPRTDDKNRRVRFREEQATMAIEVLLNIHPHVNILREKALAEKEAPPIPLETQGKLLKLEFEVARLQGQFDDMQLEVEQKDQEIAEYIEEIQKLNAIPAQLTIGVQMQLALARNESLGLKESDFRRKVLGAPRDLGSRTPEHPSPIGRQTLLTSQNIETNNPMAVPIEKRSKPLGDTSSDLGNQVLESAMEIEAPRNSGEPEILLSSTGSKNVLVYLAEQPERRSPSP